MIRNKKFIIEKQYLEKITKSKNIITCVRKCLKITGKCIYTKPAFDYKKLTQTDLETNNIFKFINNFMYGYCHEITFLMKYLLKINGIKSRLVRLRSRKFEIRHWINEFYYKGRWAAVDPTLGLLFWSSKNKRYLSSDDIKNIKNKFVKTNKKISLSKFSNLENNNFFFYKKKKSFQNAREKYFSYFHVLEYPLINDNKYSYKKRLIKNHKIKDFMIYKSIKFKIKNYRIYNCKNKIGLQNGELVNSNKFIKFKNYVFRKKISSNNIKIKNFPFPILDIKFQSKNPKFNCLIVINGKKFKNLIKNNTWILKNINKKKEIFSKPVRNISIKNQDIINSYEILFLKNSYI